MKPALRLLAVFALAALAACGPKRISGTEIEDTGDTRAVLAVIDAYRKAAEQRNADAVLALVSPQYFDDAGTADPADDMDYGQLKKQLPADYQKLAAVKIDMQVRDVVVEGNTAVAELMYDSHFRVATPRGEVAKQATDVQRMIFKKEGNTWKIVSGL